MSVAFLYCRDGETRTLDLVVPNDARYRAALHPETKQTCTCATHLRGKNNKLYRIDVRNNEQFMVFPARLHNIYFSFNKLLMITHPGCPGKLDKDIHQLHSLDLSDDGGLWTHYRDIHNLA